MSLSQCRELKGRNELKIDARTHADNDRMQEQQEVFMTHFVSRGNSIVVRLLVWRLFQPQLNAYSICVQ